MTEDEYPTGPDSITHRSLSEALELLEFSEAEYQPIFLWNLTKLLPSLRAAALVALAGLPELPDEKTIDAILLQSAIAGALAGVGAISQLQEGDLPADLPHFTQLIDEIDRELDGEIDA